MARKKVALPKSGLAIASLVLGIFSFFPFFGLFFGIISLVLGIIALVQIRKGEYKGKGLAIIGIILSLCGIFLTIIMFVAIFYYASTIPLCKIPQTENIITINLDEKPIEGNYYWLTAEGSSIEMMEFDNGRINFTADSSYIDNSSLRVIKIKGEEKLSPELLNRIRVTLIMDREYYDDIEKALSDGNINLTLKKYSLELEEYHELRNVLHNGEYERHKSSIDLENKEIMNLSTSLDFDLWYECSLS